MAQRYIVAMDYADMNARMILKKHAKKRPLGEIESKHRYTPAQPVLSCRTVDIDVSGTRTYRPKSTTDIIQEQHKLIHSLYTKSRNVVSAQSRRSDKQSDNNKESQRKYHRINIEIKGRPLTSHPDLGSQERKGSANRRQKTIGRAKSAPTKKYYVLKEDTDNDLLETSRTTRELTKTIHKQWKAENHDLNQGTFVRGKQDPTPSLDTWLSFGGAQADETSGGLIDAFAQFKENHEYYSIESGVGSRIAQQLQKGDKVRVGINGRVQSGDLRVRQWKRTLNDDIAENSEGEKMEKVLVPLCWDDQVTQTCAKVISPRSPPDNRPRPSLCETHPVVFKQEEEDKSRPRLASHGSNGYKVKQRPKSRPGLDGQEQDKSIVVLSIDQNSNEEDDKLQSLTVDDVLKHSISAKPPTPSSSAGVEKEEEKEKNNKDDGAPVQSESTTEKVDNLRSNSKTSMGESQSSTNIALPQTPRMKVVTPTFTVPGYNVADLSVGPPTGTLTRSPSEGLRSASSSRLGSEKSYRPSSERGSAKHMYKSPPSKPIRVSSPGSFAMYGTKGETEFIQISTQIKNPNPQTAQPVTPNKPQELYITQSVSDEAIRQVSKQNMAETGEVKKPTPAPASSPELPDTDRSKADHQLINPAALAINIPTAEDFSDRDSPWPSNRVEVGEDPRVKQKDTQVEQITNMLEETAVELESVGGKESRMSEKSVKFKFDD